MAFQKFRADHLFDGYRLLDADHVLITDPQGVVVEIVALADAGDEIQQVSGILSPGFINCHCHLELSHMKGLIAPGTGLVEFVSAVISQRHFPKEEILLAIEQAENEMLDNGIVAVGDICNNTLTLSQKKKGRMYYHNFIEASGFSPAVAGQRFQHSLDFFNEFATQYSIPIESNSIVPHAPYSVSDELWERIIHFPGNHLFTIHNQETRAEDELFRHGTGDFLNLYAQMGIDYSFFKPTGKSSFQSFLPKFLPNQSVVLVHNVYTTEDDIQYRRQKPFNSLLSWCLCPNANLYISGELPAVDLMLKYDLPVVLGTDSLASNHALSIISEMKTIRDHFPLVTTEQLFRWATINGAKALQIDHLLGSFEKGKKPGIVLSKEDLSASKRIL